MLRFGWAWSAVFANQRKETQNLEARKLEVMMHNNHGTFRLEKASEIFEAKF